MSSSVAPSRTETSREIWRRLTGASYGSVVVRASSRVVAFVVGVLLARFLGTEGFGAYENVMAWMALLCVPAGLGAEKLVARRMGAYEARSLWGLARGLLHAMVWGVVGASAIIVLVAGVAVGLPGSRLASFEGFEVALLVVPLLALARVAQAALQGLRRVVAAQLPELLIAPSLMAVLIVATWVGYPDATGPAVALLLQAIAAAVAFAVAFTLLVRSLPRQIEEAAPLFDSRDWVRSAVPFVAIAALQVLNGRTDVLMLGFLEDVGDVGQYAGAVRCSGLIILVILAVNGLIAPTLSRLYARRDMRGLQLVVTRSVRLAFLTALPVTIAFVLFGDVILSMFGPGFEEARTSLAILSLSQLANVAMGSVGLILLMTGHEREVVFGLALSGLLNVVLNSLLIPLLGQTGAALATGLSTVLWNVLLAVLVFRRVGVHTTVMGLRNARGR